MGQNTATNEAEMPSEDKSTKTNERVTTLLAGMLSLSLVTRCMHNICESIEALEEAREHLPDAEKDIATSGVCYTISKAFVALKKMDVSKENLDLLCDSLKAGKSMSELKHICADFLPAFKKDLDAHAKRRAEGEKREEILKTL